MACLQIDIPGTLTITDKHTCFTTASEDVCFSLPHKTQQTVKKLLQGAGSGMQPKHIPCCRVAWYWSYPVCKEGCREQ